METARAPQPPLDGQPGWGLGEAGTLPLPSNPPAGAWPPRGREDRLLGLTVTASSRPNPRAAGGPGGDSGAWQRGIWTRPRLPLPPRRRGLGRAGGLISIPWDSPAPSRHAPLPGAARSPAPGLCHRRGASPGSARNASCSRSLRWVRPPPELRERGPGRTAQPLGRGGARPAGRVWGIGIGIGAPPGGGEPAWPPLCCGHGARAGTAPTTWRKLELRAG